MRYTQRGNQLFGPSGELLGTYETSNAGSFLNTDKSDLGRKFAEVQEKVEGYGRRTGGSPISESIIDNLYKQAGISNVQRKLFGFPILRKYSQQLDQQKANTNAIQGLENLYDSFTLFGQTPSEDQTNKLRSYVQENIASGNLSAGDFDLSGRLGDKIDDRIKMLLKDGPPLQQKANMDTQFSRAHMGTQFGGRIMRGDFATGVGRGDMNRAF